ncbi:hypothetical protein I545_5108 [Mycobacterium kansasii 662]|uniref:Uncharacterized protein n=2 Tax=Mycobacterium kansasii TaxID=1768 RepID=A0A1V3X0T6_MYCKA|nr:hypothetical protein I547_2829 [Mycobacterium kansasii 824]EUA12428.1 hypothetical protein I545_5108 [Mycobacterium kansasii 662]KEP38882.1 hypothetical protein MKSMC1_58670 [Mycobacterium kansasii]OOK72678.1 hypothetical protein BZL29_5356 [Mycobacterium kansasii]
MADRSTPPAEPALTALRLRPHRRSLGAGFTHLTQTRSQ